MPSMGRPAPTGGNAFGNVQMAPPSESANKRKNVGEQLNRMVGVREESRFVDAAKHNQLDKDSFLKLLAHQLQNQDPMEPMDQKKFAADLAQFSQLEQLANLNTKMDNLGTNAPSESKFYGASFLGKEILTNGTSLDYAGDKSWVEIPFNLPENAKEVRIRLFDSRNQLVSEMKAEQLGKGQHSVTWDGEMNDGSPATKDKYRIEVVGWNNSNEQFPALTQGSGIVTGVAFEGGETVLTISGGQKVFLRDVTSFKMPQQNNAMEQNIPTLQKAATQSYNQMSKLGE